MGQGEAHGGGARLGAEAGEPGRSLALSMPSSLRGGHAADSFSYPPVRGAPSVGAAHAVY